MTARSVTFKLLLFIHEQTVSTALNQMLRWQLSANTGSSRLRIGCRKAAVRDGQFSRPSGHPNLSLHW
jgi:hypothetical protein